jgi:cell division protease FtsH
MKAKIMRRILLASVVALALVLLWRLTRTTTIGETIPYSEFKAAVAAGRVKTVEVGPTRITGRIDQKAFTTVRIDDPDLLRELSAKGVVATGVEESSSSLWWWLAPIALVTVLWWLASRMARRTAGMGGVMAVGRSKAKLFVEKEVDVSFADVAGVDEAKEELREVIDFLKRPERFSRLGGRLPRGILLVGPPGTGKTLLARAVAGEAEVPFFSISGSEFVELFVGVGAARVRDLFQQARALAPCIIFIDELDALGKVRGAGPTAHEEREQTLNQLLVEIDGFDSRSGVVLMAATNRPEILDPALLRAGRFDRHVLVDRPDKVGRLAILRLHAAKVKLAPGVDLDALAAMTAGMVGADLANLINEAALLAVRRNRDDVGTAELQEAVERVIAGLEKRNRVLTAAEKERVAHHEVGHALLALALPGSQTVKKISIVPRGIAALGYTLQVPTEDRFLVTRRELEDKIAVLLGGRVAEELVYPDVSTSAQDDLLKATEIARNMVRRYGMSRTLGQLVFDRELAPFLVGVPPPAAEYGDDVARRIDEEIARIVEEQHQRARAILSERLPALHAAAKLLLDKETLDGEELATVARDEAATAR